MSSLRIQIDNSAIGSPTHTQTILDIEGTTVWQFTQVEQVKEMQQEGNGILTVETSQAHYIFPILCQQQNGSIEFSFNPTFSATPLMASLVRQQDASGQVEFLLRIVLGPVRKFVLVTGYEYHGMDNTVFHRTRMRDFTGLSNWEASYLVIVFDFNTGMKSTWLRSTVSSGSVQLRSASSGWFLCKEELVGTQAPILHHGGGNPGAGCISITHIYRYIEEQGRTFPGTLAELSIFSHAWHGGPIIFNTDERAEYKIGHPHSLYPQRDPLDTDGRFWKDFNAVNSFDSVAFPAAFRIDALIKIWGCLAIESFRNMINAARRAHSDTESVGVSDADRTGRVTGTLYPNNRLGIHQLFKENWYLENYMYKFSQAAGIPVWGSPFGCGAMYLKKGHLWYMYIPEFELAYQNGSLIKKQRIYQRELLYMRDVMGYQFDSDWYMKYE